MTFAKPNRDISRRAAFAGLVCGLVLPKLIWAGEGGGNREANTSGSTFNGHTSAGASYAVVSQDAFVRMAFETIKQQEFQARKDGKLLLVKGFTRGMMYQLKEMMRTDPRSARRLIRDMRGLKTEKARRRRLQSEVATQDRRIKVYTQSIDAARGSTDKATRDGAKEDRARRSRASGFRLAVIEWIRSPLEGGL